MSALTPDQLVDAAWAMPGAREVMPVHNGDDTPVNKAANTASYLVEDLQAALADADPVAALVLIEAIRGAAQLKATIDLLTVALEQRAEHVRPAC